MAVSKRPASRGDHDPASGHTAYVRNRTYLESHWDDLLSEFHDEWIAVLDERVAVHAADLDEVMSWLKARDAVPMAVVELMTTERLLSLRPS
jgi:hypothetical protein